MNFFIIITKCVRIPRPLQNQIFLNFLIKQHPILQKQFFKRMKMSTLKKILKK